MHSNTYKYTRIPREFTGWTKIKKYCEHTIITRCVNGVLQSNFSLFFFVFVFTISEFRYPFQLFGVFMFVLGYFITGRKRRAEYYAVIIFVRVVTIVAT